jgi:sec-independent protein translocase protein TatA
VGRGARLFVNHRCPHVFDEKLRSHMLEGLFQPMHLLIIFGIALLVFGPKKLPELGKGLGESIRGFKAAMKTEERKPARTTTAVADDQSITKG